MPSCRYGLVPIEGYARVAVTSMAIGKRILAFSIMVHSSDGRHSVESQLPPSTQQVLILFSGMETSVASRGSAPVRQTKAIGLELFVRHRRAPGGRADKRELPWVGQTSWNWADRGLKQSHEWPSKRDSYRLAGVLFIVSFGGPSGVLIRTVL